MTLVSLPKKRCQISPLSKKFEFPALYSKQLIQIFCRGARFGTFFWQWDQSQNTLWDSATFIKTFSLHQVHLFIFLQNSKQLKFTKTKQYGCFKKSLLKSACIKIFDTTSETFWWVELSYLSSSVCFVPSSVSLNWKPSYLTAGLKFAYEYEMTGPQWMCKLRLACTVYWLDSKILATF